jgi:Flp pilus assembly protein TadG
VKREGGSVSIVVAAVILLSLVLSMGIADVAEVLIARSQARTAADAAALAVAQELVLPTGADPADVAREYATLNGAAVTSCDCVAGSLEAIVAVAMKVDGFLLVLGSRSVVARARAVVDDPPKPSTPLDPAAKNQAWPTEGSTLSGR